MPLSDFDGLLPTLARTFGEQAIWLVPDGSGRLLPIIGRFRIDPHEVVMAGPAMDALNVTQTWFYCDQKQVPGYPDRVPGLHDLLFIREQHWEIVQLDTDDLGELGYRLLKAAVRMAAPMPPGVECP